MSKPLYEVIYGQLKDKIINRFYKLGDRIPSEKELAEQFSVSRITSKKSLELLAKDKFISRVPGKGSFVIWEKGKQTELAVSKEAHGNKFIGLVISDFSSSFGIDLISGIEQACEKGAFLLIHRTLGIPEREDRAIQQLLQLGVDGLIVIPAQAKHFSQEILKLIIDKFPLVLVDRQFKGVDATSISTNNVKSAKEATKYLLELSHVNIGLLSPPPLSNTTIEDRIEGFIQAHAEAGVMVNKDLWNVEIGSTLPNEFNEQNVQSDIDRIKKLIQTNPQITAFFAIEYNIALIAKRAIEEIGLTVPNDISIICFDIPKRRMDGFSFTHMEQDEFKMGQLAVETIIRLAENQNISNDTIQLDAQLVAAASTKRLG